MCHQSIVMLARSPDSILNAVLLDKGFEPANAMWVAYVDSDGGGLAEAVTGDGRSTTAALVASIESQSTTSYVPITTIKTFRISHCSALKEDTGAMAATICDLDSLSRCLLLGVWTAA